MIDPSRSAPWTVHCLSLGSFVLLLSITSPSMGIVGICEVRLVDASSRRASSPHLMVSLEVGFWVSDMCEQWIS